MYDLKLNHDVWLYDWLRLQKGYVPITIIKCLKTAILMLFIITSKLDPFLGDVTAGHASVWDLLG